MRKDLQKHLLKGLALSAIGFLVFASQALAADPVSILGYGTVVDTGGKLKFEENNSNVTVDRETGDFTGFVWSEDVGWIDFDNNGGDDAVTLNQETGAVTGTAYVVDTAGSIDFTGHNSNVVADLETGIFSGFAWSEDVGWIDFANVNTGGDALVLEENFVTVSSVDSGTEESGTWSTSEKRPTISGTTAPNSVVTITITRDGTSVDVTIEADEDGSWSWTSSEDMVLGAYTIRIVSENSDGVLSESTFTLNILEGSTAQTGLSSPLVFPILTVAGGLLVVGAVMKLRKK